MDLPMPDFVVEKWPNGPASSEKGFLRELSNNPFSGIYNNCFIAFVVNNNLGIVQK